MKKQSEKNYLRNEKGITLIALIITIIVLLILASISIGMLRTDNSILSQARKAKNDTNTEQVRENVQLAMYEVIGKMSVAGDAAFTADDIKTEVKKYYADPEPVVTADGTKWKVEIKVGGIKYTVTIDSEGILEKNIATEPITP